MHKLSIVIVLILAWLGAGAQVAFSFDLGSFVEQQLSAKSMQLFGVGAPVAASSTKSVAKATAENDPTTLVTLAEASACGSSRALPNWGSNIDMMALWPNDSEPDAPHRLQRGGPTRARACSGSGSPTASSRRS